MSASNGSQAPILRIQGVTKRYPGVVALKDITLEVPKGQVRAIIGPNGAGKSTLFGTITGETPPEEGTIHFQDRNITGLPAWQVVKLGISRAFQIAKIFPRLTVHENVLASVMAQEGVTPQFWKPIGRYRRARETTEALLTEVGLLGQQSRHAAILSQGDKKRLEIAMALALRPTLLLLDEPTAGMSVEETQGTVELVRTLWQRHDMTVVLTEHDMSVVFALAEEITVFNRGAILVSGEPELVRNHPEVREVYLGQEA
ncbi:MAG TPA: ABC transporter ATP-binding protein [Dehalococcoidia bacterium]|nr:ABC transporter ATP-binding protein [Dehalococcoidia bacterium]